MIHTECAELTIVECQLEVRYHTYGSYVLKLNIR